MKVSFLECRKLSYIIFWLRLHDVSQSRDRKQSRPEIYADADFNAFTEFLGAFGEKFEVNEANFDDLKFAEKKTFTKKKTKQTKQSGWANEIVIS